MGPEGSAVGRGERWDKFADHTHERVQNITNTLSDDGTESPLPHRTDKSEHLLTSIARRAAELDDITRLSSHQVTTDAELDDQAQRAGELVVDLVRLEKSGRRIPQLGPGLREAYRTTRQIEQDLSDFLAADPAASGPLTLEVASPSHGHVRVTGLARFFPARVVSATNCTSVVEGNDCTLQSVDHYHVRRVSMPFEPLLEPGSRASDALCALVKDHSDGGIKRFQRELQQLVELPEQHETRASLPVRHDPLMVVTGSKVVQQGNGCDLQMKTQYVVEGSELQVIELFARSLPLVRSFVAAATERKAGAGAREFLRQSLAAADRVDDIELLDHGIGLHAPETSIWALFGVTAVNQASAVMVGIDNEIDARWQVHRGSFAKRTVRDELGSIREVFAKDAQRRRELALRSVMPSTPNGLPWRRSSDHANPFQGPRWAGEPSTANGLGPAADE